MIMNLYQNNSNMKALRKALLSLFVLSLCTTAGAIDIKLKKDKATVDGITYAINAKKQANPDLEPRGELKLLSQLNEGSNEISDALDVLDEALAKAQATQDGLAKARSYHDDVLAAMEQLRAICDAMEGIVSTEAWPLPTYNKILFYC